MAKVKEQRTWTTDDGQEFPTEAEANHHAEFVAAKKDFDRAMRIYGQLLAERQKTADGQLFTFGFMKSYWFVHEPHKSMPLLWRVDFSIWDTQVDSRDDCIELIRRDGQNRSCHRIDELYACPRKANVALLEAQQRYLAEVQQQVAAMVVQVNGER